MPAENRIIRSLVTGACGFIGSHVVEALAAAGHHVLAADHEAAWKTESVTAARYPGLVKRLARETFTLDLTDPASVAALPSEVDFVFHVASMFSYAAAYEALHKVNVTGTKYLLDRYSGSKRLKRFVHWGAGGVYGLPSTRKVPEFTEDLSPEPGNDYLRSKWAQEFLVMETGRAGKIKYTIIRPTTVYGPRGGYGSRRLFLEMKDNPVVAVPSNLTGHIPFVHAEDVARAALYLSTRPEAVNEVYNLNDDTDMTTVEYMQTMARLYARPFLKLPPVPLDRILAALKPLLTLQLKVARDVLKVAPLAEPDMLAYITEDFRYSNSKLKKTGFRFKFPDARMAFPETLQWYLGPGSATA